MSRRFRAWTRILWTSATAGTLLLAVVVGLVLSHYPYQLITTEFASTVRMTFMSHWPMSPLAEEIHARKKKRYPRAEMERIFLRDLRRMEFLNVPIQDVFVSENLRFSPFEMAVRETAFPEFPWPWLETDRTIGSERTAPRISYVLLPNRRGLALGEGILLSPGEELEFVAPLSKLRRNLRFVAVPLNTGTMRVTLGQYSWARTFGDFEVNRPQQLSITLNDTSATTARISAAAAKIFLMMPKVTQAELSGRLPLQIGSESPFWKVDPSLTKTVAAEAPEATGVEEAEIAEAEPTPEAQKPADELMPVPPPKASPVETPRPLEGLKNEELDSLTVTANSMVSIPGNKALALGYNLVVLQLGSISKEILDDKLTMEKLAPRLSAFLIRSVVAPDALILPESSSRIFQETVTGNSLAKLSLSEPILLRHALRRRGGFNLYRYLRDFGYHVVGIAPPITLGFPEEIIPNADIPLYDEKWMDTNDWNLARRRIKIDRDAQPLKGLEAIFQGKDSPIPQPLVTSDYAEMANYLTKLDEARQTFPDWQANELFLPDARESYLASVVDRLQIWTGENRQIRFLAHVMLGLDEASERASVKDLLLSFRGRKQMRLGHDLASQRLARLVLLDRAFGQIEDLLRQRRITHRTVVAVLIPSPTTESGKRSGTLAMNIPGPLPKANVPLKGITLDNLIAELLTSLGIPLQFSGETFSVQAPGKSLADIVVPIAPTPTPLPEAPPEATAKKEESKKTKETEQPPTAIAPVVTTKYAVDRFSMLIIPAKKGCSWFAWKSTSPIFGLEASEPLFELAPGEREIRIFPCAIRSKQVMVHWYQAATISESVSPTPEEVLDHTIGGNIFISPLSRAAQGLPSLFFGSNYLPLGSPHFAQLNPNGSTIQKLFFLRDDENPDRIATNLALAQAGLDLGTPAADRSTAILISRQPAAQAE